MRITKIRVEGGFLNGLDLDFSEGLNVLIGPRGAGKTSVIELLRFALGTSAHTDESQSTAREHTLAVLREGEVTVTIERNGSLFVVSRTAEDDSPNALPQFPKPIIFSQKEVESIGLYASSRLSILDGFRSTSAVEIRKDRLTSDIASLTAECQSISNEIQSFNSQVELLRETPKQLTEAKKELAIVMKRSAKTRAEEVGLQNITHRAAELSVQTTVLARTRKSIADWESRIASVMSSFGGVESWPDSAGNVDLLSRVRVDVQSVIDTLLKAHEMTLEILSRLEQVADSNVKERQTVESQVRDIRGQLDEVERGVSVLSRRAKDLEEKNGQLLALQNAVRGRREHLLAIQTRRAKLLDELDALLQERFRDRLRVADEINERLGPYIEVKVERLGLETELVNAISESLKGSGMHSSKLAPQLAEKMTAKELVECVELRDPNSISQHAGISVERAERLISELSSARTDTILNATVEDSVRFFLLDGGEYKSTENLSVGQRCTVILPILLGHSDRTLVVDQPEDHLDNAFIVDTLVEAITESKKKGQLIFSTHNANIPVLGEAEQVVLLGSDGRKGFVVHAGGLDDRKSVKAITDVMEGGHDAFLKRAQFYAKRLKH